MHIWVKYIFAKKKVHYMCQIFDLFHMNNTKKSTYMQMISMFIYKIPN